MSGSVTEREIEMCEVTSFNEMCEAFGKVMDYVNAELWFPVEAKLTTDADDSTGMVNVRLEINGRDTELVSKVVCDSKVVARMLATHVEWRAGDVKASVDVPDLWNTWWASCTANDDVFQSWWNDTMEDRDTEFDDEPIAVMMAEVQKRVLSAVQSDAEFHKNLLWVAEILNRYQA